MNMPHFNIIVISKWRNDQPQSNNCVRPTKTTTIACLIRSQDKVFEKTAGSRHTSPATASVERIEVTRHLSTAIGVKAILIFSQGLRSHAFWTKTTKWRSGSNCGWTAKPDSASCWSQLQQSGSTSDLGLHYGGVVGGLGQNSDLGVLGLIGPHPPSNLHYIALFNCIIIKSFNCIVNTLFNYIVNILFNCIVNILFNYIVNAFSIVLLPLWTCMGGKGLR